MPVSRRIINRMELKERINTLDTLQYYLKLFSQQRKYYAPVREFYNTALKTHNRTTVKPHNRKTAQPQNRTTA